MNTDLRATRDLGYYAEALGLSGSAFTLLRDLIAERTGQFYDEAKRELLADKLAELLIARGLTSFLDYYYLLRYGADADALWSELLDRLAVPETFFWRQPEQILAVNVLAQRHATTSPSLPFRIWSGACCSGEEPLSIAMALQEAGWYDRLDIQIVASDVSGALVARARNGTFGERAFRNLPSELRNRYFTRGAEGWRIDERIHRRVRWSTANLLDHETVSTLAAAEVVFCRNVFIYFSDDATRRVTDVIARAMPPGGHLFLGASESLLRLGTELSLVEIGTAFAYAKPDDQPRNRAHSLDTGAASAAAAGS